MTISSENKKIDIGQIYRMSASAAMNAGGHEDEKTMRERSPMKTLHNLRNWSCDHRGGMRLDAVGCDWMRLRDAFDES